MAARATDLTSKALVEVFKVASGGTVTKGMPVKFGSADDEVTVAGANDKAIGVALSTSTTAGDRVEVALFGYAIVPMKVGTGGATRGEYAVSAADGVTNQTLGGGTTVKYIQGRFMQTGILGDLVGVLLGNFAAGAA